MTDWSALEDRLGKAKGGDAQLDHDLCVAVGASLQPVTESVEAARALVLQGAPGWHLHVGFDATGLFPYAALTLGDTHIEASATSVPLALLGALAKVRTLSP
ncbi:hypothetical protein [Magnetospirillum moscoviense]|uniref:Uncharacterized protein n=1 Tax=Magnetospirillum moscoviense TaxID=1437059 RepID=A0A178ME01_9PROT|nr:hypothetical protein [Magnetospirillum moscoviense]OAN46367.1 hypothetical protein A6A05_03835 [Magnetospirillum moscoviense]